MHIIICKYCYNEIIIKIRNIVFTDSTIEQNLELLKKHVHYYLCFMQKIRILTYRTANALMPKVISFCLMANTHFK